MKSILTSTDVKNINTDQFMADVKQKGENLEHVPEDVQQDNPAIPLAAVQKNGIALEFVPEDLRDEKMCMAAVQQCLWALLDVPKDVQRANPAIPLAAVKQDGMALQLVPEDLRDENMCLVAVQQDGRALPFVPKAVRLDHPHICVAAVQESVGALDFVPEKLKTNVDALAKLYTTSEAQLIIDLKLLEVNDDVINQVICYLKAPIATLSSMIEQLLGTGNDSKQTAENPANSRDIIPEHGLLAIMQGYVYTPPIPGNDEKESDFTP